MRHRKKDVTKMVQNSEDENGLPKPEVVQNTTQIGPDLILNLLYRH